MFSLRSFLPSCLAPSLLLAYPFSVPHSLTQLNTPWLHHLLEHSFSPFVQQLQSQLVSGSHAHLGVPTSAPCGTVFPQGHFLSLPFFHPPLICHCHNGGATKRAGTVLLRRGSTNGRQKLCFHPFLGDHDTLLITEDRCLMHSFAHIPVSL